MAYLRRPAANAFDVGVYYRISRLGPCTRPKSWSAEILAQRHLDYNPVHLV
jgi:hypothetical protein